MLRFVADKSGRSITKLDIKDLSASRIMDFLEMLEEQRGNKAATRNIRLASIHVFFRYVAGKYPDQLELCQKILAIPFKKAHYRSVEYFEYEEIEAIFAAVDRDKMDGERDYALLVTMFNTGARVQEVIDLKICDLQLIKPYYARFFGKGRKERLCPLWPQTAELLKKLLKNRNQSESVFLNHQNQPLTRFGVRYLLAKYCNIAKKQKQTLRKKRLHPHSMRHSTAVHLFKSGVDIVTISHWLGHANINTTNRYTNIDLDINEKLLVRLCPRTYFQNQQQYGIPIKLLLIGWNHFSFINV